MKGQVNNRRHASRLPDVGTTIFTVMSKMAADVGAINLSQGFPDYDIDRRLVDLVGRFMREGHNQYAPMAGVPALLDAIGKVVQSTYGLSLDPHTQVTVTSGATEALHSTISAFVSAGDEVILFDPCYDSYDPSIRLNGGVPVHLELIAPTFAIDWQQVEDAVTQRTKMIIVNTPHNPTGCVLSASDLAELERITNKYGLIVVSDEAYERIIFEGRTHESVLRYPGLAQSSVAVFSFGKTFHATGWKIGYTVASEELTREIRKAHQFITFSINTPIQFAIAEYLSTAADLDGLGSYFERKRNLFLDQLKGSRFEPIQSLGSYFQLVSYKEISDLLEVQMAEDMTRKFKVASIPVSVFYKSGKNQSLLRFCFAKRDETLVAAGEILRKI